MTGRNDDPWMSATLGTPDAVMRVIQTVSSASGVPIDELTAPGKRPHVVRARCLAIYSARELTGASYPELARIFNRTPAGCLTAYRSIARLVNTPEVADVLPRLITECREALN